MNPFSRCSTVFALVSTLALTSCATSSHVVIGTARPPISPDDVSVLLQAPEKFETIAEVKASSGAGLSSEDEKWDRAIEGLRKEAARVGANAIVVDMPEDSDEGAARVATSVTDTKNGGTIGLGLGTPSSRSLSPQSLHALAIYVPD